MARPKKLTPKHATGMYEYKKTIGRDLNNRAIRKSFYSAKSLEDAKLKAEQYIIAKNVAEQTGENFVSANVTFENWANKWLEKYKKSNVKEHTYKWTYETNVKNYFIPFFKTTNLTNIKQIDVQSYFNNNKSLSMTTLKRQKQILFDIFDTAIDNEYCSKNPVKKINLTSDKENFEKRWYNKEQGEKIKTYCLQDNKKYSVVVYLLLSFGLRRGEMLGLKWSDIDATNNILHVRRAIEPDTVGEPKDGEVKSVSSLREIPFDYDDKLVAVINNWCRQEHKSKYVLAGKTKFGYTSIDGFDTSYKKYMKEVTNNLKLPYLTPHELRHSYGTIMREDGLDLFTISRLMGHADSKVTEKNYIGNDIEVLRKRLKELYKK